MKRLDCVFEEKLTAHSLLPAITSKKRDIPLQFWIIFFGVVTVALIAALAGLIFMLCEINWISFQMGFAHSLTLLFQTIATRGRNRQTSAGRCCSNRISNSVG